MLNVADCPREGLTEGLIWSPSETLSINPLPLQYTVELGRGVRVNLSSGAPSWVYQILARLNRLLELPVNWDSYGARPVHPYAVIYTIDLLKRVMREETPVPHIGPTVGGDVQIEWHRNGVDLEIEIGRDGRYELSIDETRESHEETGFVYDPGNLALGLQERITPSNPAR